MQRSSTLSPSEPESLDRFDRAGGLCAMASPHVHDDDPNCPHPGCGHRMEWIDFELELHGDPEAVDEPLVRSRWGGTGSVGPCPSCGGPIRLTTLGMTVPDAEFLHLPANWAEVAQIG